MTFKPMVPLKQGKGVGSPLKPPANIKNPAWANKTGSNFGGSKMTQAQVAKRKRSTISNAAGKVMGGLYSR